MFFGVTRVTEVQSRQRFWEHDSQSFPALASVGWAVWESASRHDRPARAAMPGGRARWAVLGFPRSWRTLSEPHPRRTWAPKSDPPAGFEVQWASGLVVWGPLMFFGAKLVTEAQSQQRFWEHDSQPFPALASFGWAVWELAHDMTGRHGRHV